MSVLLCRLLRISACRMPSVGCAYLVFTGTQCLGMVRMSGPDTLTVSDVEGNREMELTEPLNAFENFFASQLRAAVQHLCKINAKKDAARLNFGFVNAQITDTHIE